MNKVSQKLDLKFHGVVVKNKDQSIVPQDQWMVFLAKDAALPATLAFYYAECAHLGAALEQLEAIKELQFRVNMWRAEHAAMIKVPDVNPSELVK
jgi:ABC-type thiamine transport system substrate-binding protein